jgi:hypothetical protein
MFPTAASYGRGVDDLGGNFCAITIPRDDGFYPYPGLVNAEWRCSSGAVFVRRACTVGLPQKAKDDRFVIAVLGDGLCICSLLSALGGV